MKARKPCPCRTEDRRLTFINLNGQNTYVCRKCGRLYATREQRPPDKKVLRRVLILSGVAWAALILAGMIWR